VVEVIGSQIHAVCLVYTSSYHTTQVHSFFNINALSLSLLPLPPSPLYIHNCPSTIVLAIFPNLYPCVITVLPLLLTPFSAAFLRSSQFEISFSWGGVEGTLDLDAVEADLVGFREDEEVWWVGGGAMLVA